MGADLAVGMDLARVADAAAADLNVPDLAGSDLVITGDLVLSDFAALPDLAASDLSIPPDQSKTGDMTIAGQSVPCAKALCGVPGEECCTDDYGATGACDPAGAACPGGGNMRAFRCDGPEDCKAMEVCCFKVDVGSFCDPNGCIFGQISYVMCHKQADCQQGACKAFAMGAPYQGCM